MFIRAIAVLAAIGFYLPAVAAEKKASEPKACSTLSQQDLKFLEHMPRELIEDVYQLMEVPNVPTDNMPMAASPKPVLRGVTVVVRPAQDLTVERLQRLVVCGLARANAQDPTRPTDWPRTPKGTVPYVYSGGDKFLVDLRTRDSKAAEEMWKSAQNRRKPTS